MIRRPPRSTLSSSSAASDVYKRQPGGLSSKQRRIQGTSCLGTGTGRSSPHTPTADELGQSPGSSGDCPSSSAVGVWGDDLPVPVPRQLVPWILRCLLDSPPGVTGGFPARVYSGL